MAINGSASFPPSNELTVNGQGVPQAFTGVVDIGEAADLGANALPLLAAASKILGTVANVTSDTTNVNLNNDSFPGSTQNDVQITGGVATQNNGPEISLTEGTNISGGYVLAGSGGEPPFVGGDATLYLNPDKTSWNVITLDGNSLSSSYYSNGGASVSLLSNETAATLNVQLYNGLNSLGIYLMIYGTSLATIAFTLVSDGNDGILSVDFSGSIATDASVDNIVRACINSVAYGYGATLLVNGGCAPASSGTVADIATLISLDWHVLNN